MVLPWNANEHIIDQEKSWNRGLLGNLVAADMGSYLGNANRCINGAYPVVAKYDGESTNEWSQ